jgi:chromosome segregation protein
MLKAIELSGFKSFAEKTRLAFPPGVTVVVGPNGSGKSNVVDALKWVLGSQSAKSLRGKEMTDVIFNGSATRGPLNAAEVTLTLDNSGGFLDINAPEVHVTRRVYRSGEAEYLINRQPCRLRDIRDLLAGTGIATEAYSIIEQGKVDVLLQSSPRERRAIFEEAAGISRFKAKRTEANRRLERVEQNLLRLSDLVDEVESRLRSVRSQAGKARKYRDCAGRLEELRTAVGMADWRDLSTKIERLTERASAVRVQCDEHQRAIDEGDALLARLEHQVDTAGDVLRQLEADGGAGRAQIVAQRAAAESGSTRLEQLHAEIARCRRQLAAMSTRVDDAALQVRDTVDSLAEARQAHAATNEKSSELETELQAAQAAVDQHQVESNRLRAAHIEATQSIQELTSGLQVLESQQTTAAAARAQCDQRLSELDDRHEEKTAKLTKRRSHDDRLANEVATARQRLTAAQQHVAQRRRQLASTRKKLNQLTSSEARLAERIAVLDELQQRREGYAGGVKQVLDLAEQHPDGPFGEVCGTVAELFQVDVDTAPLVEVAIGERAQHLVLRSAGRLLGSLVNIEGNGDGQQPRSLNPRPATLNLLGRVGFLRLDIRIAASAVDRIDLTTEPGVLGRADSFVQTAPEFVDLSRRLLGRTWLVDNLATAVRLATSIGRGLSFVTGQGELLASDGTLVVGPRSGSTGLLTRASELRASRGQLGELTRQIVVQQNQLDRLESESSLHEEEALAQLALHTGLAKDLAAAQQETATIESELAEIAAQKQRIETELQGLSEQFLAVDAEVKNTSQQLEAARQHAQQLDAAHREAVALLPTLDARAQELRAETTTAQVAAARCEQRVETLASQLAQIERDQSERAQALDEVNQRLADCDAQRLVAERGILAATQKIAELALHRQQIARQLQAESSQFNRLRQQRTARQNDLQQRRLKLAAMQNDLNRHEVAAGKLQHQRETLWERLRDDYGIDLKERSEERPESRDLSPECEVSSLEPQVSSLLAGVSREEIDAEVATLRNQLNSIGAVNLDALEELDELEERFERLSGHYRDLVDSKTALERIIQRINIDSRKLFVATLETVRGHFRELFRRLFGGGEADVILEEGVDDVLEGGIEIVACPPGKETRTISLLSGGEKTLTCVALLLAVFRSKPSPFCVLDEVDAALDEANIGRFSGVLADFLSSTQFIVITHSKKTMSGANTLYGVTMQESGVSKLVSVRFEDVTEDGHILPSAVPVKAPDELPQRRAA